MLNGTTTTMVLACQIVVKQRVVISTWNWNKKIKEKRYIIDEKKINKENHDDEENGKEKSKKLLKWNEK